MLGAVSLGYFALLLKVKLTCDKVALPPLDPLPPFKQSEILAELT